MNFIVSRIKIFLLVFFILCSLSISPCITESVYGEESHIFLVNKSIDARDAIQIVARAAKLNVLYWPGLNEKIAVNIYDVTADKALSLIGSKCMYSVVAFDSQSNLKLFVPMSKARDIKRQIDSYSHITDNKQKSTTIKNRNMPLIFSLKMIAKAAKINLSIEGTARKKLNETAGAMELKDVYPLTVIKAICIMNQLELFSTDNRDNDQLNLVIR